MSSEVYDTVAMMSSISSTVSIVCKWVLLARDFFHAEGFFGETFLFFNISASVRGYLGGVTSPYFCLSSSPSSSFWSTSSSPPSPGDSDAISSDVLFISYTSSLFFFLLLLGPSYSSQDYRISDEVKVKDFCLFDWYKELCRPFLGYFPHIFLGEFVVGLELFLMFVSVCSDVNEMSVYVELRYCLEPIQSIQSHSGE
jgi:hypothetical protein